MQQALWSKERETDQAESKEIIEVMEIGRGGAAADYVFVQGPTGSATLNAGRSVSRGG